MRLADAWKEVKKLAGKHTCNLDKIYWKHAHNGDERVTYRAYFERDWNPRGHHIIEEDNLEDLIESIKITKKRGVK